MMKHEKKWVSILFVALFLVGSVTLYADISWTGNASSKDPVSNPGAQFEEVVTLGVSWATNAPVPVPNGLSQTTIVESRGILYSIGGGTGMGPDTRISQVWAYDPSSDSWAQKADIPVPNGIAAYGAAGELNGYIYVFGGISGAGTSVAVLDTTWIYDTFNDAWYQGANLPSARFGAAVALVGGRFVIAGGATLEMPLDQTLLYDPSTDSFMNRANLPLPLFRIHGASVVRENMIQVHVFAGGFDGRNHLVYDPILDRWSNAPEMPFGVTDPAVVQLYGKFYVLGGIPPAIPAGIGQIYDPERRVWRLLGPIMPGPTNNTSGAVVGNTIYVIGGFNGTTSTPTNYSLPIF